MCTLQAKLSPILYGDIEPKIFVFVKLFTQCNVIICVRSIQKSANCHISINLPVVMSFSLWRRRSTSVPSDNWLISSRLTMQNRVNPFCHCHYSSRK